MNENTLSRDVALRIGLAARELPNVDAAQLTKALSRVLGLPLTEEKLGRVTIRNLNTSDDDIFSEIPLPSMKRALDFLWGKDEVKVSDESMPQPLPYRDGDMPGSIRVAISSNSGENLDGHFGTCSRFLVYQVSTDEIRLINIASMSNVPGKSDDKNTYRAEQIRDCDLLYVVSIGGPAAAKVIKHDIHPVKMPDGGNARDILSQVQLVLKTNPPPWLAKAMGRDISERAHILLEEEAEE